MSAILGLEKLDAGWLAVGFACCTYTYAGGLPDDDRIIPASPRPRVMRSHCP